MTALSRKAAIAAALGLAAIPGFRALHLDAAAKPARRYEVQITNLTRGQIFSPPVVVTHSSSLPPLFELGSPASSELAMIAEDAVNAPLINELMQSSDVGDVQVLTGQNGPILPGETASVIVEGGGRFDRLSLVGMLVITNDAFYAVNGASLPRKGEVTLSSPAYDAGSEENNEDCAFIPGPPCNSALVRATAGAEGYVHVHAGIHGIGSLDAATFDWRNDVAKIHITAMK